VKKTDKTAARPDFDYVIVGAGSAGCVLADRLSADGRSTVLLIEEGSRNDHPLLRMPRGFLKVWLDPKYFYVFPVKQAPFRPANEVWAYGKGLGGSSAVNGTWYYRGQPADYDSWTEFDDGLWGWSAIERSYRAVESYREEGADPSRGVDGPLHVTAIRSDTPLTQALLAAGRDMGMPTLSDVNTPGREGLGATQMTVDRSGKRMSAYDAFLRPVLKRRRNLTIWTHTRAERVDIDDGRATGVVCLRRGSRRTVSAGEVILSAGVIHSPKLLMLSGIGPRALLERHGVAVVAANEHVGRNMCEHMTLNLAFRLKNATGHNREFKGWRLYRHALQYFLTRRGLMSYTLPEVCGMVASDPSLAQWPDIQIAASPYSYAASKEDKAEAGRGSPGITFSAFYLRPSSKGNVTIRSADPADLPLVDPNWFGVPEDREKIASMVRLLRRFARQPALRAFIEEETVPGDADDSDAAIEEASNWLMSTGLHGTATCRMGRPGEGVVDARLRVHGIEGLRVVDCASIPTAISGNTNGPCMAFAWRAAELILEDRFAGGMKGEP